MGSCVYECIRNREQLEKQSRELQEEIKEIQERYAKAGFKVTVHVRRLKR